jgi:ABC-type antimicrobial peptide transport system permease subunit
MFAMNTNDLQGHYDAFRNELLKTGAVHEIGQSSSPTTNVWANQIGFDWKGKDPASLPVFGTIAVSHDFGKAIGWQIKQGRDFSRDFATDSLGLILNESAVKLTGFTKPVGENIKWNDRTYTIIGVISDMVMESPYNPVKPTIFLLDYSWFSFMNIRINPGMDVKTALARIEPVYKKYNPSAPFDYKFTDLEYARKFESEERIGKLAGFFAFLAIFISCLGMFGLASFMASQRTKEIGVRKVLGASVFNIWGLLSKDFLGLVFISFVIAAPLSYLFMHNWLNDFEYRTSLSWWIFALSLVGAILITAATVSFQAIRAALLNPSRSLRTE